MVYVCLADGFEEMEAIVPIDVMRRAGCEVVTVGVTGKMVTGNHGVTVKADVTDFPPEEAEMIVLPGGSDGADNLYASEMVTAAVTRCAQNGGKVAAICAAPYILGELGLLEGKRAVCYPSPLYESRLRGAVLSPGPVCTDGNITTGRSAGYSFDFGLELVRVLRGEAAAESLRNSMVV